MLISGLIDICDLREDVQTRYQSALITHQPAHSPSRLLTPTGLQPAVPTVTRGVRREQLVNMRDGAGLFRRQRGRCSVLINYGIRALRSFIKQTTLALCAVLEDTDRESFTACLLTVCWFNRPATSSMRVQAHFPQRQWA